MSPLVVVAWCWSFGLHPPRLVPHPSGSDKGTGCLYSGEDTFSAEMCCQDLATDEIFFHFLEFGWGRGLGNSCYLLRDSNSNICLRKKKIPSASSIYTRPIIWRDMIFIIYTSCSKQKLPQHLQVGHLLYQVPTLHNFRIVVSQHISQGMHPWIWCYYL